MEDQRGIITIDIISLIISMIITEEHGKTKDIIFIDAKQYDGRKGRTAFHATIDSILISNFHYYFQDGRPMRYYNHRYYKPYNIYDYNRRTWQDQRHHIYRRKAI